MIVGLEADHLGRAMTGVANYTFNIVRSVLELEADIGFVGFRRFKWSGLELADLRQIASAGEIHPGGQRPAPHRQSGLSRRLDDVVSRAVGGVSRVPLARVLYRKTRQAAFAASVGSRHLDLFHAFNFVPPSAPGVPVLPVVYDLSTFRHPEFHPADRVRWLEPLGDAIASAPMVQTISEFSKREIVDVFRCSADKIFVAPPAAAAVFVPMGRDATERDLATLGLAYGDFFLAVGTLEPRKNIRTLIAAYGRLSAAERARYPLVVAGGKGWGDLDLPRQEEAMRRDGTLRFVAGSSNTELRSLYEGARLLLMPSLYEGFGLPVVEALACGTAVAHSADTAMDEISGGLGRRVFATDVDGWTIVLRDAMASRDHADAGLRAARTERARQFDWARSAGSVVAAYRQLIRA